MTSERDKAEVRKGARARKKQPLSKAARIYVFELREKIAALRASHPTMTRAAMCKKAGIRPTSLERAIGLGSAQGGNAAGDSRLGYAHQEGLGRVFKFPAVDVFEDGKIVTPMWPEWRDAAAPTGTKDRRDTAKAFAERYRLHLQAQGRPGPQAVGEEAPAQPADAQQTRRSGASRRTDEEVKTGSRGTAVTPMGTMAQVALELGQPAGPGAHQVLVEVSGHSTNIIGSNRRFSVRRAILAIDCKEAQGRREAIAGINGVPVQLSNANGETTFAWCGTTKLLRWDVTANGARIGYLWFDAGIIEQLAHGDVLRVSMSAWLKHIDVAEDEGEPTFGILDTNDRLLEQPDTKLTIEQQRLIEHLNKLRLVVDANGYAEIAAGEIEVVRKP